ncbi:hypothetical protein Q5752_006684 [Cryptotrichosporon argae]
MVAPPKILIANRGEIALRVIRSAVKLGIPTVAIYTLADAASPHVAQADEAYCIGDGADPRGYLDMDAIIDIARRARATMVAPGYGFLSENATFAAKCEAAGLVFLGPTPHQITSMGLKHEARAVAIKAGVPVVPGSDGVVDNLEDARRIAAQIGYPVMVKASGGGGGMGMQVCRDEAGLIANFEATREKGAALFKESAVFLEKFITRARHVEVQIFGNGAGHVVHAGERECSVQRRHQKVIEESPCVLFASEAGQRVRERMCAAAVSLCEAIHYRSAGTVEFVLDVDSPTLEFYFLELNARIQVEHGITEAVHPGLDLVELMIRQGLSASGSLDPAELEQAPLLAFHGHAIETRLYCENPKAGFKPSPGQLHEVVWGDVGAGGRIDTWVKTGTVVTPHYDPMIAKIIVHGATREEATKRMIAVLEQTKIVGPPTNLDYCRTILSTEAFAKGEIHTTFLDTFAYAPSAFEVVSSGLSTTIQDLPGRFVGLGIPRGGPADALAFQAANALVGNARTTEALEITMMGPKLLFHTDAVVAVTGASVNVAIDGQAAEQWAALAVRAGQALSVGTTTGPGMRCYLAVKGGIANAATFMGSKSTFADAGLGGAQGRALLAGDLLEIAPSTLAAPAAWPAAAIPAYAAKWEIEVCAGAQWDPAFISADGMQTLLTADWAVTPASNRSGLRLDGPRIKWARADGGEGGSHPTNVLDQGYSFAALNVNGDTPVLFGVDAPDMGGFACILTVATGAIWKMGQVKPGDTIRFVMIPTSSAVALEQANEAWLTQAAGAAAPHAESAFTSAQTETSVVRHIPASAAAPERTVRTAGDRFALYEVGPMMLDIRNRMRVELWERAMRASGMAGIVGFNTCIRSCLVHYDPAVLSEAALVGLMLDTDAGLGDGADHDVEVDINVVRLPVVPDDKWCQEAVDYYMATSRREAVYLPNNMDYVARNNGVDRQTVIDALTKTPWVVLARGFFVGLPFITLDPRRRLVAQKYNPTRTRTPEGAIGLAGVIGSIYPIASAGGYQLLGRTISTWQAWATQHFLVDNFDQLEFYVVGEAEFVKIEQAYKAGTWSPESRREKFRLSEYTRMVEAHADETAAFKRRQQDASRVCAEEEEALFQKFMADKAAGTAPVASASGAARGLPVAAPLSAVVYKLLVAPGDVIASDEQAVVELEAMKTSVMVAAGEGMAGKTVVGVAAVVGDAVSPGAPLVYLE